MSMPYVGHVLNGWTMPYKCYFITQTIKNHVPVNIALVKTLRLCLQPLTPEEVRRKPENERSWKWYSVLVKSSEKEMNTDDLLYAKGIIYRIDTAQPWNDTGYRRYHATQYYTGKGAVYSVIYKPNGALSGNPPDEYAYQKRYTATVSGKNTLVRTGYIFSGWNTSSDGTGTQYSEGDDIEIGMSNITLYAQWSESV